MFTRFAIPALFSLMLVGASPVLAATMISKVEVKVDTAALENAKAAARWLSISADLNKAIVSRLGDRIDKNGADIKIDIDSVALANSLQAALGTAESKLVGSVKVIHTGGDLEPQHYELTVSFADAGALFPEGTDLTAISTDTQEYYQAMIDAFADHVVAKLN